MLLSKINNLTKGSEKRVKIQCDVCKQISETSYANYYKSQEKKNWSGSTSCRGCSSKINGKKRRGKPAHNKGKKLDASQKGHNHPSWKGGRYISSDGYVMVYVESDGVKKSKWENYRKEHLVLMEKHIGRKLNYNEVVHHIDGNKTNNKIDNLFLTTDSGHKKAHNSLQSVAYVLFKNGLISFDRITGKYFLEIKNESCECP